MGEDAVARVLRAIAQVPPGRVASYGDSGSVAGVGPRQVGTILRLHGSGVPWWRVTNRDGVLVPLDEARVRWAEEGIVVRADGRGCRLADHRADPHQLAADYLQAGPPPVEPGGIAASRGK